MLDVENLWPEIHRVDCSCSSVSPDPDSHSETDHRPDGNTKTHTEGGKTVDKCEFFKRLDFTTSHS